MIILNLLFASFIVQAQMQSNEIQPCTELFLTDFAIVQNGFLEVGTAIDENEDEQVFRAKVINGLNQCHSFVEKYVQIDPSTGDWNGQSCLRVINENQTEVIAPRFHKAECEYLQRILDREN